MSSFTYESDNRLSTYETFEWDNTWIDHANDTQKRRALYIGDSISCGTRKLCTERSGGTWLFDGFGTSKALDNPVFWESLRLFASQEAGRDAILFNNGLHGWHLRDDGEYAIYYERMIWNLQREYPDTPLYLVLSTSVQNTDDELRVQKRNEMVTSLAKQRGLPIIDLYSVSVCYKNLRTQDGVHYTKEGYEMFADAILNALDGKENH